MKKLILLLLATSLLFITSCELFTDEPTKNGKIYSVIIGLDYTNTSYDHLSGTINDANELRQAFTEVARKDGRGYTNYQMIQEENTVPLIPSTSYPSKSNVKSRLNDLANITTEDDLTILTYSGHGVEQSGDLIFGRTSPATDNFMSVTELLISMSNIKGKKLVILDSCYSGMFVESSPSSTSTVLENSINKFFETYYSSDKYGKPDLFVLTASAHAKSYEKYFADYSHSHGIFTYALLQALGWDHPHPSDIKKTYPPAAQNGRITVDGLYRYIIKNQLLDLKFKLINYSGYHQHPLTTGGPLDLVLFNL